MADDTPKTIILGGDPEHRERVGTADTTVLPGHLVEYNDGLVRPHATDGGAAGGRFAVEAREWGKTIETAYAPDEQTKYITAEPGVRLYLLLAAGESVADGDPLISAGDGALRGLDEVGGDLASSVVAEATEPVDNSGGDDPVRVRTEAI